MRAGVQDIGAEWPLNTILEKLNYLVNSLTAEFTKPSYMKTYEQYFDLLDMLWANIEYDRDLSRNLKAGNVTQCVVCGSTMVKDKYTHVCCSKKCRYTLANLRTRFKKLCIEKPNRIKSLKGEVWKVVPDSNNCYAVSNYGRIKSLIRPRVINDRAISGFIQYSEHLMTIVSGNVLLTIISPDYKDSIIRNRSAARIFAKAWLPNPNNYSYIQFKDGNHNNVCPENVFWTSENTIVERNRKNSFKVRCIETGKVYNSQAEACRLTGTNTEVLSGHLNGKYNSANSMHWVKVEA